MRESWTGSRPWRQLEQGQRWALEFEGRTLAAETAEDEGLALERVCGMHGESGTAGASKALHSGWARLWITGSELGPSPDILANSPAIVTTEMYSFPPHKGFAQKILSIF